MTIYAISQSQFLAVSKLVSLNADVFTNADLTTYVDTVYQQVNYDSSTGLTTSTYYPSTPCTNTVSPDSPIYTGVAQFNCPNMTVPVYLEGTDGMVTTYDHKYFNLLVGTCEELSSITLRNDCESSALVLQNL